MKKALFFLLVAYIAALCGGCASQEPVVTTTEIKVPIPTKIVPPPELLACGQDAPGFKFYAPAPDSPDLLIRKEDQPAFQKWIEGKSACIGAWQEWAR